MASADEARAELGRITDPGAALRRHRRLFGVTVPVFRVAGNAGLAIVVGIYLLTGTEAEQASGGPWIGLFIVLSLVLAVVQSRLALLSVPWSGHEFLLLDFTLYAVLIVATGGASSPFFWVPIVRVADQPGVRIGLSRAYAAGAITSLVAAIVIADGFAELWTREAAVRVAVVTLGAFYLASSSRVALQFRVRLKRTIDMASRLVEEVDQKNDELERLADEAETLARVKGDFLATMSHEIRTPVNGILGTSELLLDSELDPDQRHLTEIVQTSADTLLSLINDILDLSKLDAEKMVLESIPVNLKRWVDETLSIVRTGRPKPGVALSWELDPQLPPRVLGDPVRLRQILLNIAGNALKFTEAGTVVVRLMKDEDRLRVDVVDTGIGMSPETAASVFDPFTQAEAGTTRRFGGTGLGLAITQKLVTGMGGSIEVESELGVGSTFRIRIPLRPAGEELEPPQLSASILPETFVLRVLVAEDNPVNVVVAQRMFKRLGIEIDVAANGREAVKMATEGSYDVVFMDMQMPEMDGVEAASTIAQVMPEHPPIVALTANAFAEDRKRCRDAGMAAFLSKPVRLSELRRVLVEVRT